MTHTTPNLFVETQHRLLTPSGLEIDALFAVLDSVHQHDVDFADLYFQYCAAESWSLDEGIVKSGSFSISQGVGVRAVSGEKTAFAYLDDFSLPLIREAASVVRAIGKSGGSAQTHVRSQIIGNALYGRDNPINAVPEQEKVALLERLEKMVRAIDPRVTQVMASLAGEWENILVLRSDGRVAADVRPLVRVSLQVIVEQGQRRESGRSGGGGRLGYSYFSDETLQAYANEAVQSALTNLDARPAPAGPMTVVLGSGWPGILLHEAIGHGLEGDFNRKGTSAFSGRIGERVAAPGVTVVDDGTIVDRRGSLNVDDEGEATSRTVLIEDGILKGYLQDHMNARLMGVAATGNGRRESYAHIPMPRMTNTMMDAGQYAPEEIIASVKDGLYAHNFGGGQVDITSGKFVFTADEAWRIENGKLTYPVKGATLIGNGPDVLTRVAMIGNDLRLDSGVGTCGKEGQSVPVGVGQPTIKIMELTVGGTG